MLGLSVSGGAQAPETGTITGRVRLTGRVRGTPLPSNAYQPRAVRPRSQPTTPEIKNVIVYLKGPTLASRAAAERREIRQQGETFVPRVLAVTRGSTVEFPNGDAFYHNVFSLSGAATFDLGRFPQGQTRAQLFNRAGLVKVYCRIHAHMSASILILDHRFFTVPELDGTFTLPDVPRGTYTIVGWHERVGERAAAIQIHAGEMSSIELALPVDDAGDDGR